MASPKYNKITIETKIKIPAAKAWELWTSPAHITKWNAASDDWHTPGAENDLKVDGKFKIRMEAKDGSSGFDFGGVYTKIIKNECIEYTMDDGRVVQILFTHQRQLKIPTIKVRIFPSLFKYLNKEGKKMTKSGFARFRVFQPVAGNI